MSAAVSNVKPFPAPARFKPDNADKWAALFEDFEYTPVSAEWMKQRRLSAATSFEEQGIPTPKLERWKYTDLANAVRKLNPKHGPFDIAYKSTDVPVLEIAGLLSDDNLPDWLTQALTAQAPGAGKYGDMALWELAQMFTHAGLAIELKDGQIVDNPVEITIIGKDGLFNCPRTVIRLGAGAQLTIIENHEGQGTYWKNRLSQISIGPGATLRHYRVQNDSPEAVYTQNTHVTVDKDGCYEAFVLTQGAKLSRNQVHVELNGPNAEARLMGINLLKSQQIGDTTITIEHKAPDCNSNQTYKTVLADKARGVFQGKVHVHQIAQKTDGYQLSNALLLSPLAEMDTKPELEIYADDVKCSHGATTGQLDEDPLFYMQSRGIPEKQARRLLIEAFLGQALEDVTHEQSREIMRARANTWLEKAHETGA